MIKLIGMTDIHLTKNSPVMRKDDYNEAIYKKLEEIRQLAIKGKVDGILFPGDLFHKKTGISEEEKIKLIRFFKSFPCKIYCILGNHDEIGYQAESVERNSFGVILEAVDNLILVDGNDQVIKKNNIEIRITGTSFYPAYDIDRNSYFPKRNSKDEIIVNLVHGTLLEKGNFFGSWTNYEDILKTEADVTFCGHYHPTQKIKEFNKKYIVCPGSIGRGALNTETIDRIPKIVLVMIKDKDNIKVKYQDLKSAKKSSEIFKIEEKEFLKEKEEYIKKFVKNLKNTQIEYDEEDFIKIVEGIGKEFKIERDIVDRAIVYISGGE